MAEDAEQQLSLTLTNTDLESAAAVRAAAPQATGETQEPSRRRVSAG